MAEDLIMKDSVFYTMDDGIMSPEEMEMEADQIFKLCRTNSFQRTNFNCECLAGAFLIEREKRGPMIPQSQIVADITKNKPAACADTVSIAGKTYTSCMVNNKASRSLTNDAAEYCTCVGNKVAKDFEKNPRLTPAYVRRLNFDAMLFCQKPENRPNTASAEAAKAEKAKTAN